jgi:hypothetical protein
MYRAKDIGWLALESLCRQEDIDFEWELIVAEEAHECFGEEAVRSYGSRLAAVGCVRVLFTRLDEWVPLAEKWRLIAHQADSFGFLLVAADCYSQPKRLAQSYVLLQDYEWVQSPLGAFYDISSGAQCVFDHSLYTHQCALNMGLRTELTAAIPQSTRRRNIDSWMFRRVAARLGRAPKVGQNLARDWMRGVDTQGMNNISAGRRGYLGVRGAPRVPFRLPGAGEPQTVDDAVPPDVAARLKDLMAAAQARQGFVRGGSQD